MTNITKNFLEI